MSSSKEIIVDEKIPNWGDLPYTLPSDGKWVIHFPKDITINEFPTSGLALARRQSQHFRRMRDSIEFTQAPTKCQHEFIDVGFSHTKLVCKHCDTEK